MKSHFLNSHVAKSTCIYLFNYASFYNAVSSSSYIVSNDGMINERRFGRAIMPGGTKGTYKKTSVLIVNIMAKIQIRYLLNTSQKRCCLSQLDW
jgi:hypothetical protein